MKYLLIIPLMAMCSCYKPGHQWVITSYAEVEYLNQPDKDTVCCGYASPGDANSGYLYGDMYLNVHGDLMCYWDVLATRAKGFRVFKNDTTFIR